MRQLGELEALVMIKVWDSGSPLSVRDVVEQLQSERKWAYTTVMTVLDRLAKKGLLQRHRQGRSFLYSAALSEADYTADQMQQVLHLSDDQGTVLLRFVDRMEAAELAALRAALSSSEHSENSP